MTNKNKIGLLLIALLSIGVISAGAFVGPVITHAATAGKRQLFQQNMEIARQKAEQAPKPSDTRPPVPYKTEPKWAYEVKDLKSGNTQTFPPLRYADSYWEAGSVSQANGTVYCPLLVYTATGLSATNPQGPFIGTMVEDPMSSDAQQYNQQYPCPRNIGKLTITEISGQNGVVRFTSSSGVTGTFNLATHKWSFK